MARLNFADVPEQKEFSTLPTGIYVAEVSNLTYRNASDTAKNPNALILRWEFEVVNNEDYSGRKVWDNQVCVEDSMWKVKSLLDAAGVDTSELSYDDEEQKFQSGNDEDGYEDLDLEELIGQTVELKVGVRPARKDQNTNREYPAQNRVNAFYPHEASDAELLA